MIFAYQPLIAGDRHRDRHQRRRAGHPGHRCGRARRLAAGALRAAATIEALQADLPPTANVFNPIDVIGDARSDRYRIGIGGGAGRPERGRGAGAVHAAGRQRVGRNGASDRRAGRRAARAASRWSPRTWASIACRPGARISERATHSQLSVSRARGSARWARWTTSASAGASSRQASTRSSRSTTSACATFRAVRADRAVGAGRARGARGDGGLRHAPARNRSWPARPKRPSRSPTRDRLPGGDEDLVA